MPGFVFSMVIETFEVESGFFILQGMDCVVWCGVPSPKNNCLGYTVFVTGNDSECKTRHFKHAILVLWSSSKVSCQT